MVQNYLSVMSRSTKFKCLGVLALALAGSFLASLWPVRLGKVYTAISDGRIATLAQGAGAILTFGLIYLAAEWVAIFRRVMLDCVVATHEAEVRDLCVEKLLKMPVAYYSGCLSGEKTAQLNQGVAGFGQLIKILCNDVFATTLTAFCTLGQVLLHAPGIIAGIMLLYLVLTVGISFFQIRSQNGIREQIIGKKNALDGQICQSISNLELIRSMSAVYILDESTANLDGRTADLVLTNLERHAQAIGAGILYIAHDPSVARRCDTTIELANKIVAGARQTVGQSS